MNKEKINKVISVYNYKKRFFLEFDEEQGWIIADNIAESLKRKERVEVSFDRVPKVSFVFITSMLGKLLICHGFSVKELEEYIFYTGLNVGIGFSAMFILLAATLAPQEVKLLLFTLIANF